MDAVEFGFCLKICALVSKIRHLHGKKSPPLTILVNYRRVHLFPQTELFLASPENREMILDFKSARNNDDSCQFESNSVAQHFLKKLKTNDFKCRKKESVLIFLD